MIDDLHHRLERRGFVAVDRVGEPDDERRLSHKPLRVLLRKPAWIAETADVGFDSIDAAHVLGRRRDDEVHTAILVRVADVGDDHAVGRGSGDRTYDLLHLRVVGVKVAYVEAEDALRARHVLPIRSARVKVERGFVGLCVRRVRNLRVCGDAEGCEYECESEDEGERARFEHHCVSGRRIKVIRECADVIGGREGY